MDELDDKTPWWATPEHCKDDQGRPFTDPNYDPTTLYIPPAELNKLTNAMK